MQFLSHHLCWTAGVEFEPVLPDLYFQPVTCSDCLLFLFVFVYLLRIMRLSPVIILLMSPLELCKLPLLCQLNLCLHLGPLSLEASTVTYTILFI